MTFPKECKIDGVCAKKNTRYAINGVRLDTENKRVVATDGHMLVTVPVHDLNGDVTAIVPKEAFKALRAGRASKALHVDGKMATVEGGGSTQQFPVDMESSFPPVDQVLEGLFDGAQVTVALSAHRLKAMADAMADAMGSPVVYLYIKADNKPIGVRVPPSDVPEPNACGVLMPVARKR